VLREVPPTITLKRPNDDELTLVALASHAVQLATQLPLTSTKPGSQLIPHDVPSHVATPFAGTEHIVQLGPQASGSVDTTHIVPHA
jgi:hypothetical protein